MDPNIPPPPAKSNTVLWVVMATMSVLFCCCGGMAYWGVTKGSTLVREAGNSVAQMTAISARITTQFHAQANLSFNSSSMNGVSTSVATVRFVNSQFSGLDPVARHALALDVARFTRAQLPADDPYTQICVDFATEPVAGTVGPTGSEPHCFAWGDLVFDGSVDGLSDVRAAVPADGSGKPPEGGDAAGGTDPAPTKPDPAVAP